MTQIPRLELRDRRAWRTWLSKHHAASPGIWLLFPKKHTGEPSIPYEDSVREALCFGWIDSLIKRLDDDRYARKFTPRTPASKWSDINRKRWSDLKDAGLLAAPGLRAAPTPNSYARLPELGDLPDSIADGLQANPKAWACFQKLAPSHRRNYVAWIHTAKRPETREKRIREAIATLRAGQKLGLK
jgi:uncharacterized protein YdeI (YjbR/CyaY-like superfamily)